MTDLFDSICFSFLFPSLKQNVFNSSFYSALIPHKHSGQHHISRMMDHNRKGQE